MCLMWQRIRFGVKWKPAEMQALAVRGLNLQKVKNIRVSFDPFHPNNRSLREFWAALSGPKVKTTNPQCLVKVDIRNDRRPPYFEANLADGHRLVFKTEHMHTMDIAMRFNRLLGLPELGQPGVRSKNAPAAPPK
uniref:Large ribosomal subunit protein mL53 n=1 Tax=Plectus sambesii TaxID=2011161 RepID=A0A914WSV8_9BILA